MPSREGPRPDGRLNLVFLDMDGVLNGHQYMREAESCNICRPCVLQLNRIIRRTDCHIVLSSAWRYMVHGRAMTLSGFGYMLRTHGVIGASMRMIGLTDPDEVCPTCGHRHTRRKGNTVVITAAADWLCRKCGGPLSRGKQVTAWLKRLRDSPARVAVGRYVVLDDDAFDFAAERHPFVQTDGSRGMTRRKADRAIAILLGTE